MTGARSGLRGRRVEVYERELRDPVFAAARQQGASPAAAHELADELPGALLSASPQALGLEPPRC